MSGGEERLSATVSSNASVEPGLEGSGLGSIDAKTSPFWGFLISFRVFKTNFRNFLLLGLEIEIMDVPSYIQTSPPPGMESAYFSVYLFAVFCGLFLLHAINILGRPVAHPNRKLGSNHKEAEAKRVEILERLHKGSKVGAAQHIGGDVRLLNGDVSDVEKEPLCSQLLPNSTKEATEATITLSCDTRFTSIVLESMKEASEPAASGELVDDSVVFNAERTMLQTKVELHDGIFERLKNLVKLKKSTVEAPLTKESTPSLQIDNWAILKPSHQGVELLRLPVDKLPVILHAEYAAGVLTITGLNLENASIFILAHNAYNTIKLKVFRFLKATNHRWYRRQPWGRFSDTKEDVVTLPLRLSWKEMEDVFVYATKKVQLGVEGQSVDAVSKAVRISDCVWKTVLGLWIPCIAIWIFLIYNTMGVVRTLPLSRELISGILSAIIGTSGMFPLLWILILFGNPSSRRAEFIKYHVETMIRALGQGLLLVYYGFKGLKGPHLKFHSSVVRSSATPLVKPPPPSSSGTVRSRLALDAVHLNSSQGSAKSVDDPDWMWPAFDHYESDNGRVDLKKCSEKLPDDASPFQVMYRRKKQQVWPDVVQIDLISPPLIKIVQKFLSNNGDLRSLAAPKINGRDLFVVLDDLKNHEMPSSSAENSDENKGGLHLKHLIRFMDKEYRDVSVRLRRMTEEKRVAWDMLWTFFTPGRKVVYICDHTQEMLAGVVSKNSYTVIQRDWAFFVDLDVWDYNGRSYRKCQMQRMIAKFDGEVAFSTLAVRPFEIEGVPETLDEGLLANGKRFYELAVKNSHRFMHYSGPLFQLRRLESSKSDGCVGLVKENADGRVMIDHASFAKMNPGYKMGNAKPPVGTLRKSIDSSDGRRRRFEDHEEILDLTQSSSITVADETLIFAPAIVYGFSFTLKQWGSFAVSGFSEISFNTNAFDSLVMEPDSKQLVYKLVSQYIATPVDPSSEALQGVDPIARKGEGCIFLCYGPPGTGKTLTAESMAESMHRPLWSLSASELGATPEKLEKTLLEVLEIAATWRAVLLLDEADGFLQKRTSGASVMHNAMTGVFLRFLEYYRGVLFLTTNRIGTFDKAFRSRISMFLRYPKLSVQQKEQIWMALLERATVAGITAEFVSEVAAEDLNGREIRNSIHTAQILAKSNGETLDQSHVRHVTRVLLSTLTTLTDTIKSTGGSDL